MKRRGRPKTPDLLTPRELEVLALLREGSSNREIADRLGISLAGAKFHVSEIIGKLGVSSREEAASWRRSPALALPPLPGWRRLAPVQISVALVASAAVLIAVAVFMLAMRGSDDGAPALSAAPTATAEPIRFVETSVSSIEAAQGLATFALIMPAAPPGYRITSIRYFKPNFRCPTEVDVNHCAGVHNDYVRTRYEAEAGGWFEYTQGYGGPIGVASYHFAPDSVRGRVSLNGRDVGWVTGHMKPGIAPVGGQPVNDSEWVIESSITLTWFESRDANPTGGDSPRCLGLYSSTLSREELLQIAASVPPSGPNPSGDPYNGRC